MKKIAETLYSDEEKKDFDELQKSLEAYRKVANQLIVYVDSGNISAANELRKTDGTTTAKHMTEAVNKLIDFQVTAAKNAAEDNRRMASTSVAIAIGMTIVGVLIATGLGIFLTLMITRPINRIVTGMAEGAEQVAAASSQVSGSSQNLAEGASEQASSLEETSSSLEEMASMSKQNAGNAGQARAMMQEAKTVVDNANRQMAELIEAIAEITRSSEETGKIIKTIDEIAFQTNLLALNAAVEAARAGEAGAGFAVVADEVRNLAMRSAEAAKNTSALIEKTIKAVQNGNKLTMATQEAFKGDAEISGKVAQLVDEIATASEEQSHGVDQINKAVSEMDKVTQQTAANAEESASASEELNAQAQQMRGFVEELMAVVGGNAAAFSAQETTNAMVAAGRKALSSRRVAPNRGSMVKALPGGGKKKRANDAIPFDKDEGDFKNF
jgi:methyl-accepting chemotaxis protein